MNERADWVAWSLQFVVGLVAGALCSVAFMGGGRRFGGFMVRETSPMFTVGAALIGAALASYFGDQLWLRDSHRVIPPDEPRHSLASRWVSFVVGCIGVVLILVAVARSLGWFA